MHRIKMRSIVSARYQAALATVIPKWVDALLKGDDVFISVEGETSRDFCYIDNAVRANLLAATVDDDSSPTKSTTWP